MSLVDACSICHDSMDYDSYQLPCSHAFHARCLVPWFRAGRRDCPMCRAVEDVDDLESTDAEEAAAVDDDAEDEEEDESDYSEAETLAISREVTRIEHLARSARAPLGLKVRVARLKGLRQALEMSQRALRSHATRGKGTLSQLRKQRQQLLNKEKRAREKVEKAERDLVTRTVV